MNWLHYLAEANLYLTIFYLIYCLLFSRETHYQLNRTYLLFSCVAAFALPVLQLGILKPAVPITVKTYPTQLFYPELNQVTTNHIAPVIEERHLTWQDYLIYAYAIGCAILLLALLVKLFVLIKMIWNAKREQRGQYKLIYLLESDIAFSFLNYLFIGTDAVGKKTIITHELVHINQKHSLDILFIELLKIINWFNPFIYLLQNSLKITHEYIADEHTAARENDTLSYATFLVNNAYGTGNSSITHSFFNYNLLKKRIIMLNQQRSGTSARLKYLIAVPVFAGLLCASTLAFSKDYGCIDLDPATAPTRMEMLPSLPSASVEDPQTKLLPPPPPMLTTQGYDALSYHLYKSINYRPSKTNKDGIALIGFTITSDHKITDAKIIKSAGKELDATAINAFGSYKLSVNDKAGKGVARIYFYTTNNGIFKDLKWLANYKIDILVTGKPHIYPTTAKGYDYQVYDIYRDDEHTGKFTQHINKVVIFEKDGEAKEFVPGKDNMRIAKEKYGYSLPAGYVKFPPPRLSKLIIVGGKIHSPQPKESISADSTTDVPPNTEWAIKKWGDQAKYGVKIFSGHTQITKIGKVVKPTPASNYQTSGDTTSSVLDQFYKELARNIHYPAIVRSSNTTGKVFAIFSVDDNGILQQLKIVRGISNSANAEVFRVIKASPVIKKMTGNWVVPVNFTLSYEEGSAPDLSVSLPPSEIEKKTFEYNPGNITPSDNNRKMLDEIVIRSYVKSKN